MGKKRLAGLSGKIGVAVGLIALWATPAFAAPPANDDFADRQVLSGSLPLEAPATNFEATKEAGEFLDLFAAAGHSVWFEWEATATDWVTIGACNPAGEFHEVLGVYTGSSVGALTKVVNGNPGEGPHCPFTQREYTFKAVAGTKYEIAVDGNVFGFPDQPPPVTEGTAAVRIEATPVPANDDFAAATPLMGSVSEEPDGHRFYFGSGNGYNWEAGKEAGEPDHGGDQGGASVWYSWTAPESGVAHVGLSTFGPVDLLGVYVGDSVAALTEVKLGSGFANLPVVGGTAYRIAVDGTLDSGSGEPGMGSFSLMVSMDLKSLVAPAAQQPDPLAAVPPPSSDTTPPQTSFRHLKERPKEATTKLFAFSSSESPSSFRCRLDKRAFAACGASKTLRNLKPGRHTFEVVAVDAAGNKDPTPAVARFRISQPQPDRARG